jgi:hypothetical protein
MSIDPARARRLIVAATLVGLALRLAFGLLYWTHKPLTHDEREYLALAHGIAGGRGFAYDDSEHTGTGQQFGRAPGYPVFLAAVGAGVGDYDATPARVTIAQSAVGAIGVWLIGLLAMRAGGSGAGVVAAAIAAVYPPLVFICAYVLSEALYSTLGLAMVLLLDLAIERSAAAPRDGRARAVAAASGLIAGAAMLTRPAMLLFLPIAAAWMVWRRRGMLAAVFIGSTLLIVTPWTARNVRVYHRFVLVASEGGVTFWTGNHPLARGEGDLAANPDIKLAELAFRREHPGLTPEQLEPLYYRDALSYIAAHPVWWMGLVVRKVFYTVVPIGPSYTLHSNAYFVSSAVSYLLLLPVAAAGARRWWQSPRRSEALGLLTVSAVMVCLVFFPQERFRIPVIDPALIVCAGMTGADRMKRR